MLFDLRGRGRRRMVQVIYLGLALLIGVGLVGFGIGGGFGSGGLFNAVSNSGGGASSFSDKVKSDQKAAVRTPNNPAVWAALAHDAYQQAGTGANYDQNTGQFTSSAQPALQTAAQAWNHYLSLNPAHPDPELANLMLHVFEPGALNQPNNAVAALQIVIANNPPSEALYATLAQLSYLAGNAREGDLAAGKAVALAPKAQQSQLKSEFAQIKKNPSGAPSGASPASASAPAQTVTVPASQLKNLKVGGSGSGTQKKNGK